MDAAQSVLAGLAQQPAPEQAAAIHDSLSERLDEIAQRAVGRRPDTAVAQVAGIALAGAVLFDDNKPEPEAVLADVEIGARPDAPRGDLSPLERVVAANGGLLECLRAAPQAAPRRSRC